MWDYIIVGIILSIVSQYYFDLWTLLFSQLSTSLIRQLG